mmetsp:Transcript_10913/g.20752  ORF Transcript_10913/g.20752 Transcript_10913/m.20752 type:complete len:581 (+) Transcript_10913:82-1824(+)|eukprot:CAMPEP_0175146466 /NCGR_PEP_ID=MMETSP0087-20121206/15397_1 /TAXON_ID=136419 /ORGANISM="Unknown Unknown, Strain D1" /LENGTH=580 /DNA_ID=CAMNT_0016431437 /DNA_START=6 /DNA_END=1748 /DNA_ORIENTATION=+
MGGGASKKVDRVVSFHTDPVSRPSVTTTSATKNSGHALLASRPSFETPSDELNLKAQMGQKNPTHAFNIKWKKGSFLGKGSFGSVVLGLNVETGELMAVKQIVLPSTDTDMSALEQEINLLRSISFPYVVKYLGCQLFPPSKKEAGSLDIFLEFVPGGSIASVLSNFGSFEESLVRHYTRQVLLGLEYLHRHNIVHRDIKGGNILLDASGVCKLADFGASAHIKDLLETQEGKPSITGTVCWMAPEVIKQEKQDDRVDIWSMGCTVVEMASGKPPWQGFNNPVAMMYHIATTKDPPLIPDSLSKEGKDFIRRCLTRDPKQRPSASELLKHPFVDSSATLADISNQSAQSPDTTEPSITGQSSVSIVSPSGSINYNNNRSFGDPSFVDSGNNITPAQELAKSDDFATSTGLISVQSMTDADMRTSLTGSQNAPERSLAGSTNFVNVSSSPAPPPPMSARNRKGSNVTSRPETNSTNFQDSYSQDSFCTSSVYSRTTSASYKAVLTHLSSQVSLLHEETHHDFKSSLRKMIPSFFKKHSAEKPTPRGTMAQDNAWGSDGGEKRKSPGFFNRKNKVVEIKTPR